MTLRYLSVPYVRTAIPFYVWLWVNNNLVYGSLWEKYDLNDLLYEHEVLEQNKKCPSCGNSMSLNEEHTLLCSNRIELTDQYTKTSQVQCRNQFVSQFKFSFNETISFRLWNKATTLVFLRIVRDNFIKVSITS